MLLVGLKSMRGNMFAEPLPEQQWFTSNNNEYYSPFAN
jgi:hypothetical protein